jgi:hypothetical protein
MLTLLCTHNLVVGSGSVTTSDRVYLSGPSKTLHI